MSHPIRVLVGTPTMGRHEAAFKQSVFRLVGASNPDVLYVIQRDCQGSNIAMNQNKLARMACDQGFDYLLLAETDIAFPSHGLAQLLSHGKDIIGCATPWKEHDLLTALLNGEARAMRYMGHELDDSDITLDSLIEAPAVREVKFLPMGFCLISTRAIRAISEYRRQHELPDYLQERAKGRWIPVFTHIEWYPEDSDEGVISTTDSSFCRVAREAGFPVWLDARLSLWIEHIGSCNYVAPERLRQRAVAEAQAKQEEAA